MSNKQGTTELKKRILETLFSIAPKYHEYYSKTKYLVISPTFKNRQYYIISSSDSNFLHLTGLDTSLDPYNFFKNCESRKLKASDFRVSNKTSSKHVVSKNNIKAKLSVLPNIIGLFSGSITFEEDFKKGTYVTCELAAGKKSLTLGFAVKKYCQPKTLLKGNYIDKDHSNTPVLILSGPSGSTSKFDKIVLGDIDTIREYITILDDLLSDDILKILK